MGTIDPRGRSLRDNGVFLPLTCPVSLRGKKLKASWRCHLFLLEDHGYKRIASYDVEYVQDVSSLTIDRIPGELYTVLLIVRVVPIPIMLQGRYGRIVGLFHR